MIELQGIVKRYVLGGETVLALAGVLMLVVGLSWIYRRVARASGGSACSCEAGRRRF